MNRRFEKKFKLFLVVFGIISLLLPVFTACSGNSLDDIAPPLDGSNNSFATNLKTTTTSISTPNTNTSNSTTGTDISNPADPGPNYFSISINKEQINPGDEFTIDIIVNTNQIIRGAQVNLQFDPAVFQYDGIEEGDFFKSYSDSKGLQTILMKPDKDTLNENPGNLSGMGIALMGYTPEEENQQAEIGGATGSGVLLSCKMTAKSGINEITTVLFLSKPILSVYDKAIKDVKSFDGTNVMSKEIKIGY
ncbi:MAG: hypothetical protein JW967_11035 [Dehalococcoidales bacterium]|nr:hypothetical protein [Dehalococcoidales bacterium]